ncbi:MAG: hypothetical protein CL440_00390 [Acidimicrobiaceae bacterium]|nr:hypothetical protein [Acidimicrobiaceae bacterium]
MWHKTLTSIGAGSQRNKNKAMAYSHLERANDLEPSDGHRVLREECPLHREENFDPPFYVVSRHDDVIEILKSPKLWGNADGPGVFYQKGGVLGSADDPDHARQRKVLREIFLPSKMRSLENRLKKIRDDLWKVFEKPGNGDFVDLFAFPFPAFAIAEILGVDPKDREKFHKWADDIVAGLGGGDLELVDKANLELWSYIDELVEERLMLMEKGEQLPDDAISTMTIAFSNGQLSRREIQQLGHQLLVAGHETTASLLALMIYRLSAEPELLNELKSNRNLIELAVEEFLRFDSPVQGLFRTNSETCPVLDTTIPARTKLQAMFASANRDPAIWEDPDSIRFDRDPKLARQHLAFGWGVHYCIGAPLARLEACLALEKIVESLTTIEVLEEPPTTPPFILRGFTKLNIRWT